MIELDGSYGEGGGQLVRMATGLAAITGKAVRLSNVRAHRDPPGLAPQHLAAVRAVADLCAAQTEGLELRANDFTFAPQKRPSGGEVRVDVGTAGSVTLVLQALVPVLIAAAGPSRATIIGGTDVRYSPSWDYFKEVLLRHVSSMGLRVRGRLVRRGYYPRGGGAHRAIRIGGCRLGACVEPAARDRRTHEGVGGSGARAQSGHCG